MKRTIFTLVMGLLILSTVCANAQDVIVKKDNSTILSKVTKISSTEIEYKKWSNQDGPTYTINKSEVVSINYQNGEVEHFSEREVEQDTMEKPIVVQQSVQTKPDIKIGGYMERAGNDLALDGRDLSDEEVRELVGEENYRTYLSAKKQLNTGRALTIVTIASFAASAGLVVAGVLGEDADLLSSGIGVEIIADVFLIGTIVYKSTGKGRLNWVADEYNKQHQGYSLNLSPSVIRCKTPQSQNNYALGMTLRFSF